MCCDYRVTEVRTQHHEQPYHRMRIENVLAEDATGWDLRLQVTMSVRRILIQKKKRARTRFVSRPMEVPKRPSWLVPKFTKSPSK